MLDPQCWVPPALFPLENKVRGRKGQGSIAVELEDPSGTGAP